jgi:hypothetical protein
VGWKGVELYYLRHSALTVLAESPFNSSNTVTLRYRHPQADAIERAFGKLARGHNFGHIAQLQGSAGEGSQRGESTDAERVKMAGPEK